MSSPATVTPTIIPISAPTDRPPLLPALVGLELAGLALDGLELLDTAGDVATVDVELESVLDEAEDDAEGPTVCAMLIAPCAVPPQHVELLPPQHHVDEFALPSQGVTCAFPFES